MPNALKKPDWEKDTVYLVQFKRSPMVPSLSPFCLKLETWLRLADINYENLEWTFMKWSSKGQMPFVELNGEEIPDSNFIIAKLAEHFQKDLEAGLSEEDKATALAFHCLIEDSILWTRIYQRCENIAEITAGITKNMSGLMKMAASPLISWRYRSALKTKIWQQGIGRHSLEEAESIAKKGLKSLSVFLGQKKFLNGDHVTRLDATAFGHLCQIMWGVPKDTALKKYVESDCANLIQYLDRIKTEYWPDWDRVCKELTLDNANNWREESKEVEEEAVVKIVDVGAELNGK